MLVHSLDLTAEEFHQATGWELKPEGLCKGDVCVPTESGDFDARAVADQLGMALVHDDASGQWAIGPESLGGRSLATAVAPELVLPDIDGNEFRLSSLRGQKVVLVAWAPY